jgi:hypothetical protein
MSVHRRTRIEIELGRTLRIDQSWLSADDDRVWVIAQIHRLDCQALLRCGTDRQLVRFEDLHKHWQLLTNPSRLEAA